MGRVVGILILCVVAVFAIVAVFFFVPANQQADAQDTPKNQRDNLLNNSVQKEETDNGSNPKQVPDPDAFLPTLPTPDEILFLSGEEQIICYPGECGILHESSAYGGANPYLSLHFGEELESKDRTLANFEELFTHAFFSYDYPEKAPNKDKPYSRSSAGGESRNISQVVFESFTDNTLRGRAYAHIQEILLYDTTIKGCGGVDGPNPDYCYSTQEANIVYEVNFEFKIDPYY